MVGCWELQNGEETEVNSSTEEMEGKTKKDRTKDISESINFNKKTCQFI